MAQRLLFLLLLLLARLLPAAEPAILVGKEVEVAPEKLVHILRYFDLDTPKLRRKLRATVPKEYLRAPASFASTDNVIREKWDLAIAEAILDLGEGNPKLRADCPQEVREVLSSTDWSRDGRALEFRDTKPFSNIEAYVEHTRKFFELVKMNEIVNNPMKHLGKTYFHFHLSVLNGRDHTDVAERINSLSVLKFIEGGAGVLALTDAYGYSSAMGKGLLRLVTPQRIEMRNHFISPEGDLRYLVRLLTQPEKDSRIELSREIRRRLTPEAFGLLARYRAADLVHIIDQTNVDLPGERLPLDMAAIRQAFRQAIRSPDVYLGQYLELLAALDARKTDDTDGRRLADFVAKELRARALASPEALYRESAGRYARILTISDRGGKLALGDARWIRPVLADLAASSDDRLVRLRAFDALVSLAPFNAAAKAEVEKLAAEPRYRKELLPFLEAAHLDYPEVWGGLCRRLFPRLFPEK